MDPVERELAPAAVDLNAFAAIVDVRRPSHRLTQIPGSVRFERTDLEGIGSLAEDPATPILIYCAIGELSRATVTELRELGYTGAASLAGGIRRWESEGRTLETVAEPRRDRYDRHVRLDGIGVPGQDHIRAARVIVVGAGGLGSPALQFLATAGVGTLTIVDGDFVEASNLQRQVLFDPSDLGRPKADAAVERVLELNSDTNAVGVAAWLDSAGARDLMRNHDLVIDASDNYETRLAVNDAAVALEIPLVHGAAIRWEGLVAAFDARIGPCYRCLFPRLPDGEEACSVEGVLGAVTGVIGSLMAVESIKHIVRSPDRLVDRLITYDGRSAVFSSLRIERSAGCPLEH
jgi:molybdopterin/thiamine biosynthesis adenylyltransferase/rhodanese-related sulfurtransferase